MRDQGNNFPGKINHLPRSIPISFPILTSINHLPRSKPLLLPTIFLFIIPKRKRKENEKTSKKKPIYYQTRPIL